MVKMKLSFTKTKKFYKIIKIKIGKYPLVFINRMQLVAFAGTTSIVY